MSLLTRAATSFLFLALALAATAHGRLSCPDANSCFMNMPLYSQNDTSLGSYWLPNGPDHSQLCGPTSAAMAVAGAINSRAANNALSGWTNASFLTKSWQERVTNMATLVGCSPTGGTMFWPLINWAGQGKGVDGRAGDFKSASGTTTWFGLPTDNSTFVNSLRDGSANTMVYGHYTRNTNKVLGVNFVTFSRNGGHFVAPSGHWYSNWVLINNPWHGINEWRSIATIGSGTSWRISGYFLGIPIWVPDTVTILPNGLWSQGVLLSSGTYYGLIEGYTGLKAN